MYGCVVKFCLHSFYQVDGDGTNPFGCFTEVVRAAPENVVVCICFCLIT